MKEKIENLGKVAVTIEEGYWDIKKPYDKLTIVEREGTGTTFISRKPVPPGTSILNRKYWIKFSKWSDIPYELTQKFGDSEELAISQKTLTNKFSDVETEMREGDEALDRRLRVVEVHERIMVEGGELEIATGYDLEHPESPRQEAAVPTVRAILDASDDEPHLNSTKRFVNSDNLAKTYGYYLDNPEFVYLLLDAEYHIIFGAKINGDIVFGVGVPSQIREYVEMKVKECSPEDYEDIVDFLDGIEFGDKKLQELLDEKVNKVEGKSLIDEDFANGIHYRENPEFVELKLDSHNRIIEATYKDGTKILNSGYNINGNICKTLTNPEFIGLWTDNTGKIIAGIEKNGDIYYGFGVPTQIKNYISKVLNSKVDKEEGKSLINKDYADGISYKQSQEFVKLLLDNNGKIICGVQSDGNIIFGFGVPSQIVNYIENNLKLIKDIFYCENNPELIKVVVDSSNKVLEAIKLDGTKIFPVGICTPKINIDNTTIEHIADSEYIDVVLDANKKLLEGTKKDGTKIFSGNIEFLNDIPQQIKQYIDDNVVCSNWVSEIIYDEETGDLYAVYSDTSGITNVYMDEETGDIYVEQEID